ncbi:MAG: GerMN domain-containing protein [Brevinematia bacterium]
MKRLIFILSISSVLVIILATYKICFTSKGHFKFYYVRQNLTGIDKELREVKIDRKTEKVEKAILEEYLLGPLSYKLTLNLPPEVRLQNFYIVRPPKSVDAVIDFNPEFLNAVEKMDELTIKAMLETLKANTRIKRVLFLSDGKKIRANIGKYNLSKFIELK